MEHTGIAFGPPWYRALKCGLFIFGIPAVMSFIALTLWPKPVPPWAFLVCPSGSLAIWFAGIVAWAEHGVPSLDQRIEFFANQSCPTCYSLIGRESAMKAHKDFSDRCDAARRTNPQARINFVRYWHLTCPKCGSELELHYVSLTIKIKAEQAGTGQPAT